MLFIFRAFSIFIYFIFKAFPFLNKRNYQTNIYGLEYRIANLFYKYKKEQKLKIYIPVNTKIYFKIQTETKTTRLFKKWGLTSELQTNDPLFNEKYYIACDNIGFLKKIKNDGNFLYLIKKLLDSNSIDLSSNSNGELIIEGTNINPEFFLDAENSKLLIELKNILENFSNNKLFQIDIYGFSIYIFELITSTVLFYGILSFIEYETLKTYYFLNLVLFYKYVFITSLLYIAIVFVLYFLLVGTSSRSPFIFIGNMSLNILFCFFVGFGLVSDLNIKLDKSETTTYKTKLNDKNSTRKGFSRKHSNRNYYFFFDPATKGPLPDKLSVGTYDYFRFEINNNIEVDVKNGWLKIPYISELSLSK